MKILNSKSKRLGQKAGFLVIRHSPSKPVDMGSDQFRMVETKITDTEGVAVYTFMTDEERRNFDLR